MIESIEKLRELAADMTSTEILDHLEVSGKFLFHTEWIDSWHSEFDRLCDKIEREISERYMELPVDADGVPIRTGDIIEFGKKGERLEVTHIGWTKHGEPTIAYRRPNGTLDCSCIGTKCRHAKPRTIEDVLREYRHDASVIYDDPSLGGEDRADALKGLDEKVAAEIRELMEAGE